MNTILISLLICFGLWFLVYFLVVRPLIKDAKSKSKKEIQDEPREIN